MEVLNLRDQRYFAMNNFGKEFPGRTGTNKNARAERRGREIVQLVQKQYFLKIENLLLSCLFLVLILSPTLFGFTKPPQILYILYCFIYGEKKKKKRQQQKQEACLPLQA